MQELCSGCTGQWQKWVTGIFFQIRFLDFFSRFSCWGLSLWVSAFGCSAVFGLDCCVFCCALLYKANSQAGCVQLGPKFPLDCKISFFFQDPWVEWENLHWELWETGGVHVSADQELWHWDPSRAPRQLPRALRDFWAEQLHWALGQRGWGCTCVLGTESGFIFILWFTYRWEKCWLCDRNLAKTNK